MSDLPRCTYRGVDLAPGPYEKQLSAALFGILAKGIHDLAGIVAALNDDTVRTADGRKWTETGFAAELARLSDFKNSTGAPLGDHLPGIALAGSSSQERTGKTFRDPAVHLDWLRTRGGSAASPTANGALNGNATLEAKAEARATLGLRDRWWCIGPSTLVGDKPVALMRLGERLVAWRSPDGKVNLVADRCPHRAAPLSMARVVDGRLSCRYHGVQVTGDGTVAAVPAFPDCDMVGKKLVRAYPAVEHFQAIWAWFGDEPQPESQRADPKPLRLPEELTSDQFTGLMISNTWYGNYQYAIDNVSDIMHPPWVHGDTLNFAYGSKSDVVEAVPTETGVAIRRKNDPGSSVSVQEYVDDGVCYTRVGVFAPPANGPGGFIRIIATACPIDAQSCQFTAWRLRQVTGWQAALYRFMFYYQYDRFMWEIIDQDREMVEALPPWPPVENLYQHDIGVSRVRRHIRKAAEAQVRALEDRTGAAIGR